MADLMISKADRRKVTLFVTCLVISITTWLFFTLSGSYVYETDTAVTYKNAPSSKAFHPLQPDTVTLKVQGTGWQLLFDKMRLRPVSVTADMKELGNRNFITFNSQLSGINRQINSKQRIVSIDPDTLFFDFSTRSMKKVPVRLLYDIAFKKPFGISSVIRLEPAMVTITGPESELARIHYWPTDSLKKARVDETFTSKVTLGKNSSPNIEISPRTLTARVPVNEFTEKVIKLQLHALNHTGNRIKLLPGTVTVRFLSSLSGYHDRSWDKISAVVDADNGSKGFNQLPVKLLHVPPFSKIVSIDPQAVDFIGSN